MDWQTRLALMVVAAPAAVVGIALVAIDARCRSARVRSALCSLAVAGAATGVFVAHNGAMREAWSYAGLLPLAGLATAMGMAWSRWRIPILAWAAVLGVLVTAAIWPVLRTEGWWMRVTPGAAAGLLLLMAEPAIGRETRGIVPAFACWMAAVATGAVVLWDLGSVRLATGIGALGAGALGWAVVSAFRGRVSMRGGPMAVFAATLGPTLVVAWLYVVAEKAPVWAVLLPAFSPVALWVMRVPLVSRRRAVVRGAVGLACVGAAAAGGAIVGPRLTVRDASPNPYEDLYGRADAIPMLGHDESAPETGDDRVARSDGGGCAASS